MATVRKREWTYKGKDKFAYVVTYNDQSGKRRQQTFDRKHHADNFRRKVENEVEQGIHTHPRDSITIATAARLFLEGVEDKRKAGVGVGDAYFENLQCGLVGVVVPALGKKLLSDLARKDVEQFGIDLARRGRKPGTVRTRLQNLRVLIDWAVRERYINANVVRQVITESGPLHRDKVRTFEKAEIAALFKAMETKPETRGLIYHRQTVCFVHIAAFCGLRFGEIAALRPQDVDFKKKVLRVRRSVSITGKIKAPKTRAGIRDVPLPDEVADVLSEYIDLHFVENDESLIFLGRYGTCVKTVTFTRKWHDLLKDAGLVANEAGVHHFHALRHFFTSLCIARGMPVTEVAKMLGHAKFDVTLQVYAHALMTPDEQVAATQRMVSDFMRDEILTDTEFRYLDPRSPGRRQDPPALLQ